MISSPSAARIGSQAPRVDSYPLFVTSAADDAVDIAAMAGLTLDPWQEHVLRCSLGERADGRWSAFRVGLVVPRQNGKNVILEARELAGLFLFGEKVIIHSAHEYKTARKAMQEMMARLKASPDLMEHVKGFEGDVEAEIVGLRVGNDPAITLKNGNKLSYQSRSKGAGRGLTGDLVVLDEAYALRADQMAALLPTLSARSMLGNPQVWLTSSAGMQDSDVLAGVRSEGIAGADRLAYFEWSAREDAETGSLDAWYEANPALGLRISEEYVADEMNALLEAGGEEEFRRERLGIWAKLGGESVFHAGLWESLGPVDGTLTDRGDRCVLAVDVTPNRDAASIVAASVLEDGRVHVEVAESMEGTSWVPATLTRMASEYDAISVVAVAGSAAEALLPAMKRAGTRVRLVRYTDYVQACGMFFDAVSQRRLVHLGDPILGDAVDAAQQKWRADGSSWSWSRKSTDVDISPLVAATLAVAHVERKQATPARRRVRVL